MGESRTMSIAVIFVPAERRAPAQDPAAAKVVVLPGLLAVALAVAAAGALARRMRRCARSDGGYAEGFADGWSTR